MSYLRFNPYYRLSTESIDNNALEFPFQEGDIININFEFGSTIEVTEDRKQEDDLVGIDARMESVLYPFGEEIDDYIIGEAIIHGTESKSTQLKFSTVGLENVFHVILTHEDDEEDFIFEPGQIISVPLIVEQIMRIPYPEDYIGPLIAHLKPAGEEVEGLILTEVVLVD